MRRRPRWPMDIVETLTRKVPVRLADEYFGFSALQDEAMMGWARSCFREFFINLLYDSVIRAPAVTADAEMHQRLDALLAERRTADLEGTDDVIGRCCACSVRMMSPASTMTAYAEPWRGWSSAWWRQPRRRRCRRCWCCSPSPTLWPAPRPPPGPTTTMRSPPWFSRRFASGRSTRWSSASPRKTTPSPAGEPHRTLIRKGTAVFALTWSAMFDLRVLDA